MSEKTSSTETFGTRRAPPERKTGEEIAAEVSFVRTVENLGRLLQDEPEMPLILNQERQMVFANQALIDTLGMKDVSEAFGARPGEIIQCVHSTETAYGCGTAEGCRYCRAVFAVLESQRTKTKVSEECRIVSRMGGQYVSFDLNVTAVPLQFGEQEFSMLFMRDISDLKRKEQLERSFFHDIINTAGGLKGLLTLAFLNDDYELMKNELTKADSVCEQLLGELFFQRDVLAAEQGNLESNFADTPVLDLLNQAREIIAYHPVADKRTIVIDEASRDGVIQTDPTLARRVLVNLVKNAVEATPIGGIVRLGCELNEGKAKLWVHNCTVMEDDVRQYVFHRSFSTKGVGRGLGTYSVRLLTERCLGGLVGFESSKEKGTTFHVTLPGPTRLGSS